MHASDLVGKRALLLPCNAVDKRYQGKLVLIKEAHFLPSLWHVLHGQTEFYIFEREMLVLPDNITDKEIELLRLLIGKNEETKAR